MVGYMILTNVGIIKHKVNTKVIDLRYMILTNVGIIKQVIN